MRSISKNTKIMNAMYNNFEIDKNTILHKTELLLKIYKPVIWSATERVFEICETAEDYSGKIMDDALDFLANYAPEYKQNEFQDEISSLFETRWLINLVDQAMIKVKTFPTSGELYHEIITLKYLSSNDYSESEILEKLQIGRSTFYDKRAEAISLFGICMWGYAIPDMRGIFETNSEIVPVFFKNNPDFYQTESR